MSINEKVGNYPPPKSSITDSVGFGTGVVVGVAGVGYAFSTKSEERWPLLITSVATIALSVFGLWRTRKHAQKIDSSFSQTSNNNSSLQIQQLKEQLEQANKKLEEQKELHQQTERISQKEITDLKKVINELIQAPSTPDSTPSGSPGANSPRSSPATPIFPRQKKGSSSNERLKELALGDESALN